MSWSRRTLDIDYLNLRQLNIVNSNNLRVPQKHILISDGSGSTQWNSVSSIQAISSFSVVETNNGTITANPNFATLRVSTIGVGGLFQTSVDPVTSSLLLSNGTIQVGVYPTSVGGVSLANASQPIDPPNLFNFSTGQTQLKLFGVGDVQVSTVTDQRAVFIGQNAAVGSKASTFQQVQAGGTSLNADGVNNNTLNISTIGIDGLLRFQVDPFTSTLMLSNHTIDFVATRQVSSITSDAIQGYSNDYTTFSTGYSTVQFLGTRDIQISTIVDQRAFFVGISSFTSEGQSSMSGELFQFVSQGVSSFAADVFSTISGEVGQFVAQGLSSVTDLGYSTISGELFKFVTQGVSSFAADVFSTISGEVGQFVAQGVSSFAADVFSTISGEVGQFVAQGLSSVTDLGYSTISGELFQFVSQGVSSFAADVFSTISGEVGQFVAQGLSSVTELGYSTISGELFQFVNQGVSSFAADVFSTISGEVGQFVAQGLSSVTELGYSTISGELFKFVNQGVSSFAADVFSTISGEVGHFVAQGLSSVTDVGYSTISGELFKFVNQGVSSFAADVFSTISGEVGHFVAQGLSSVTDLGYSTISGELFKFVTQGVSSFAADVFSTISGEVGHFVAQGLSSVTDLGYSTISGELFKFVNQGVSSFAADVFSTISGEVGQFVTQGLSSFSQEIFSTLSGELVTNILSRQFYPQFLITADAPVFTQHSTTIQATPETIFQFDNQLINWRFTSEIAFNANLPIVMDATDNQFWNFQQDRNGTGSNLLNTQQPIVTSGTAFTVPIQGVTSGNQQDVNDTFTIWGVAYATTGGNTVQNTTGNNLNGTQAHGFS